MAYLNISDFKFGMDRRRPQTNGVPGTLWTLKNAVISRGGDIVRAKKFVSKYTLPANTFGFAAVKRQPFVFGSATAPTMPTGVQYQQLAAPSSPAMTRVIDARPVDGLVYAIAEYADGSIYHFYDGSRVTSWDALADAAATYGTVAEALAVKISANAAVTAEAFGAEIRITADTPGTAFTCTATATDVDSDASAPTATRAAVTANVAAVAETVATGTVEITGGSSGVGNYIGQVTVNGVSLLAENVFWTSSNSATANALVVAINNNSAVSGYVASAVSAVVTIAASAGTGATPNGYVVATTVFGDVTTANVDMAGGVAEVEAVAQVDKVTIAGGTFDATDRWSVTVNGTTYQVTGRASAMGTSILVHKRRVYSPAGSLLRYCVINDPTDWSTTTTPSTDAGFINMSAESDGSQSLLGSARYNDFVAVFAREGILIWTLDADADNNAFEQALENTGPRSARSIVPYGNTDVFYLADDGVRSIRSRDGYNVGFVSDIGSAVDTFVQGLMDASDEDTVSRATAAIDPRDGRYMLAIDDTVVVLSYFPMSKITAWSYIEPGFAVDTLLRVGNRIYARGGDAIYLYGGNDNATYPDADEQVVTVETPFMSANDPAGIKLLAGFDVSCTNDWALKILPDPNDTSKEISGGVANKTTNHLGECKLPGRVALIAFRLTCEAAGDATFSSIAIHYDGEGAG